MRNLKILIILIFALCFGIINVDAEVRTKIRNQDNNYGVNKKWVIDDSNMPNVLSTDYVDASEKVYDFAGILTDKEVEELKGKIQEFISKYNIDLVILTVNKSYFYDSYNETVATDFYDYNDFGLNYEKYDGILIYRNAWANDPYYDIYTFGDAQLYFNQTRYDYILDSVYSDISTKNYFVGFSRFIDYIENYYKSGKPRDMNYKYVDDFGYLHDKFKPPFILAFIISSVVTLVVLSIMISKNKMVKQETKADIYLDMSTINFSVRKNNYSHSRTTSYTVSSSSGSSGGHSSGGSSRGSSGGGHSSGGGRHG